MTARVGQGGMAAGSMRGVAFGFLLLATLCVVGGMVWGIVMAASGDHALRSAHAHLNLVGWATMAVFGIYYALTPAAAVSMLARIHLGLAAVGVAALVPGVAMAVSGGGEALAIGGSLLSLASGALFLAVVLRHGFGRAD